jgi:hypothetical protein
MTRLFDKLNLRPQERRLVVIVGVVVFIVLNFVFVFPNFGAFGQIQQHTIDARKKLDLYNVEIKKQPTYQKEILTLQGQGMYVSDETKALTLQSDVNLQAHLCGVTVPSITPMQRGGTGGKTNAFFEEQSVVLNVVTGEKELIDFLYRLADKELLIRAKSMQISPDPQTRMRLQGSITLVKSFQRKAPPKPAQTTPSSSIAKPVPTTNAAPGAAAPKPAETAAPRMTNAPGRTPAPIPPTFPLPGATNRTRRVPPAPLK